MFFIPPQIIKLPIFGGHISFTVKGSGREEHVRGGLQAWKRRRRKGSISREQFWASKGWERQGRIAKEWNWDAVQHGGVGVWKRIDAEL
jgi:hypothetical protein